MKRFLDLIAAATLLALSLPALLVIGLLVRISLGSPVIFRQVRPGLGGKLFELVKFRTMKDAADTQGDLLPDADRITAFGKALRATSLDELPSLWNVLKGDMSLVGPRPLLPEYLPLYSDEQSRRHDVRPGITGLAQISGRNDLPWDDRLKLDVWYVDNHSLWLDLTILLRSVVKVLRSEGVAQQGHVTSEKFKGSTK